MIGEVSLAAEAFGVHPGMRLGEALARCPRLTLVPPDPAGVADVWERLLVRLESIGAAVEPERPGLVCFDARGLLRLHGGIEGVLAAARRALRVPARYGVAPSRFAAVAAATRARVRRPVIVAGGRERGARLPGLDAGGAAARPPRAGRAARGARAPGGEHARRAGGAAAGGAGRPLRRGRACSRTSWPAAATARCARGPRASWCASRSSCPRPRPAFSSSAGWGC